MFDEEYYEDSCTSIDSLDETLIASRLKNNSRSHLPDKSLKIRRYFNELEVGTPNFTSLTDTPLKAICRGDGFATAVSQLAYDTERFSSIVSYSYINRKEIHGCDAFPAMSAIVRELTGKNISNFKKVSIRETINNQLDLIAFEGKFCYQDFAAGRKISFHAEVESGGKLISVRGYKKEEKVLFVVNSPFDIERVANLNKNSVQINDSGLFSFRSLPIPNNFTSNELLENNMPYVVATFCYNLGKRFLYDPKFLKKRREVLPTPNLSAPYIYSFRNCSLPSSSFFDNGEACFQGETNLNQILTTDNGNKVMSFLFKIKNPKLNLSFGIEINLAFVLNKK